MEHKLWYDEVNETVRLEIIGKFSNDDVDETLGKIDKLLAGKRKRLFLANISQSPNLAMDKDTRQKLRAETRPFDRIALVGATPITRMLARVVMTALGKSATTRFCDNVEEGLTWLKKH